jgi:WG containing repeat
LKPVNFSKFRHIEIAIGVCILSATASLAREDWRTIDKKGVISAPLKDKRVPWTGWEESQDPSRGTVWKKKEPDGFSLVHQINFFDTIEQSDRISIYRENSTGRWEERGFVDNQGRVIIEPIYFSALDFYNGLAAVQPNRGDAWQLIDKSGAVKYKLPLGMHPQTSNRFKGVAKNGVLPVATGDYLNSFGKIQEEGLYDLQKKIFHSLGKSVVISEFSEGLAAVSGEKNGFVDASGTYIIPQQYDHVSNFAEGLAVVLQNHQWKYIDHNGKTAITLPDTCSYANSFSEGLASVAIGGDDKVPPFLCTRKGAKWGFIDKTGKLAIEPLFYIDGATGRDLPTNRPMFKEGLAQVAIGDELHHKYGFIDKTGKWKIDPQFRNAQDFTEGKARVCLGQTGFSKDEWNDAKKERNLYRYNIFRLFAKQYGLLNMSRNSVNEILGKPDKWNFDSDIYTLTSTSCGNQYCAVEIRYDLLAKVSSFRILGFEQQSQWLTDTKVLEENLHYINWHRRK